MAHKKDANNASGAAFFGCMVIGTGIGLAFDESGVGWLLGTGVGLLVMAFMRRNA